MALPFEGRVFPAVLALAALLSSGCSEPEARMCPTGIYCPAGKSCAAKQAICISDGCGNGKLDPGEVCDDGNKRDNDGCSADCRSAETCGNGVIDRAAGEACDDGNMLDGDKCSANCRSLEACGNGITDPGEDCDGGVTGIPNEAVETEFCNSDCTGRQCGDGIVNESAGEECDGGPSGVQGVAQETAECNTNCKKNTCGDGIVNRTDDEECDDGPLNSDGGDCLTSCYVNDCGDGHVNRSLDDSGQVKEECDLGLRNSDSGNCLLDCHENRCGDGHQNQTDDGTGRPTEGCDSGTQDAIRKEYCLYGLRSCTLCSECTVVSGRARYCGDGVQQTEQSHPGIGAHEACDLGPNNGATSCGYTHDSSSCDLCNSDCSKSVTGVVTPHCGDGIKQGANEACDDGASNGSESCPYGQAACVVCNAECTTPVERTGEYCGDFVPNGLEGCDSVAQFACGTCRKPGTESACTLVTTGIAAATGRVTFPLSSRLEDFATITLTLSDGQNDAVTFRFGDAINGGAASVADIAGWFVDAVASSGLRITAGVTTVEQGTRVALTNSTLGVVGNVPAVVYPESTTVLDHEGMSDGIGCAEGQQCASREDCVAGVCDPIGHTCTPN